MKKVEMAKATASLADYAREVSKEPIIVTVKGKPTAALVSIENADLRRFRRVPIPSSSRLLKDRAHVKRRKVDFPVERCVIGWG